MIIKAPWSIFRLVDPVRGELNPNPTVQKRLESDHTLQKNRFGFDIQENLVPYFLILYNLYVHYDYKRQKIIIT